MVYLKSTENQGVDLEHLEEIVSRIDLQTQLPWVEGVESERGHFRLRAVGGQQLERSLRTLLVETVVRGLVPGQTQALQALSSAKFSIRSPVYLYVEVGVHIELEHDAEIARRNLAQVAQQVRVALAHPGYGLYLRDTWGLSPEQKMLLVCERLESWRRRFPRQFEPAVMGEASHFALVTRPAYRSLREAGHLARLIATLSRFRGQLTQDSDSAPDERHLYLRLFPARLRFPFGIKPVMGVLVGASLHNSYELLEERHLDAAVRRLVSRAQLVQGSAVLLRDYGDSNVLLYADFETKEGDPISLQERRLLQRNLPRELEESVEQLTHSLFMRRNEEETLRTILALSSELRELRDVPQVSINFVEQTQDSLTFSVILLRLASETCDTLEALLPGETSNFRTIFEWRKTMGSLPDGPAKEANVFCIQLRKEPFLRKDYAVDLHKARRYIVSILTKDLGEVRDYNGGLIIKQEEVLAAAKRHLCEEHLLHDHLLDRLFYSLVPAAIQGALAPRLVTALFELFCTALQTQLPTGESYRLFESEWEGQSLLIARYSDEAYHKAVNIAVDALEMDRLLMPSGFVEGHGAFFSVFLLLRDDAGKRADLRNAIGGALREAAQIARAQRTLRISLPRMVASLDPRIGGDRRSGIVIKMLYEGLTRIGKDGRAELSLAQRISISPDQRRYTFELRKSIWSDGSPVTAHDFEYGWKKALDPGHQQRWTYMFDAIKNAKAARQGEMGVDEVGIKAISDQELQVELEHPAPYFLDLTAHWLYSPLRRDIDEDRPGWAYLSGETFVCNGPFQVAEFRRGNKIHLVKNPHYWDAGAVKLRGIDVLMVGDPQVTAGMFQLGQLDVVGEPLCQFPPDFDVESEPDAHYFSMPAQGVFWYVYNTERFPFTSRSMRRAFCLALNRKEIIREAKLRDLKPALSYLPERLDLGVDPGYVDNDLKKARHYFRQGLRELGLSSRELPTLTIHHNGYPAETKISQVVARQWREAFNIDVQIESVPWQNYIDQLEAGDYQVACNSWFSWFCDPIYNFQHFKHPGRFLNYSRFEHAEYISLLNASDQAVEKGQRDALLQRAENILLEEMPAAPICYERYRYISKRDLRGLRVSDLGQIDFKHAYFSLATTRPPFVETAVPTSQRIFRAPLPTPVASLDPGKMGDRLTRTITQLLYAGLMQFDQQGQAIAGQASSYTVSEDGKRYTFQLREALWSDGTPIDAIDYVRSWQLAASPEFDSAWAYVFSLIRNGRAVSNGELPPVELGVWAPDERTLVVELEHPAPYFLELTANPILFPHPERPAFNGPFVLTHRSKGDDLQLTRNPYYWDSSAVKLDALHFDVIGDPHTAYSLFQRGELDYLGDPFTSLPKESLGKLKAEGRLEFAPTSGLLIYAFDCTRLPFTSTKIRRAFALALDRTDLSGDNPPAHSPLPSALSLCESGLPPAGDPQLALQLFEEGLEELGLTREKVGTITLSHPTLLGFEETSQKIRCRWQELFDLPISFVCIDCQTYYSTLGNPLFQVSAAVWYSWHADPSYNLKHLHLITQWNDPRYSALLQNADGEVDPGRRRGLLRRAEEMLLDEMPAIPIHAITHLSTKSPDLKGDWVTPQGLLELREASLPLRQL